MTKLDTYLSGILVALVALTCNASEPPPLGVTSRGTVVRVVDGDTVDLQLTYKIRVRLDNCWAPEKNTEKGKKAHEDLDVLALGRTCILHVPTVEARSLADVFTFGRGKCASTTLRPPRENH
jgi:endonuclease YncB( thermonuclease family)